MCIDSPQENQHTLVYARYLYPTGYKYVHTWGTYVYAWFYTLQSIKHAHTCMRWRDLVISLFPEGIMIYPNTREGGKLRNSASLLFPRWGCRGDRNRLVLSISLFRSQSPHSRTYGAKYGFFIPTSECSKLETNTDHIRVLFVCFSWCDSPDVLCRGCEPPDY